MIKVCHITSAHGEEDVRIFHKECVSLAKNGYEVYLVQRGESYEKNGVKLAGFGEVPSGRIKRILLASRIAYKKALEIDADIYHFHDPDLLPYGEKLAKMGKHVIFDCHESTLESIEEKTWIPAFLRPVVAFFFDLLQRRVCRRLDAVVIVSPNERCHFESFAKRIACVTNYPILKENDLQLPRENRVAFAGGISQQWDHHRVIEALEQLPDCRYWLCGGVDDGYLEQLQQLKGWAQTDYMGMIPHSQVAEGLARSRVGHSLLIPGKNTDGQVGTLGNTKIFEEMMAGLPVVCTNFDLWREFVERYHCGICVDPTNTQEIADAIRYLLEHPEEAQQMGENGRRAVREEFNWGVEEKKLFALYEDILNQ